MFRRFFAIGGVIFASLFIASPAFAHVTAHPDSVPSGGSDAELTFRVPNEEDNSSTSQIDIHFPTDNPLLSVEAKPIAGWTATVTTAKMAKPITTDDGTITDAVSEIVWKASPGSEIQPNEYQDFDVAVGQLPSTGSTMTFPAIQTYADGDVVKWIEATPPNGAEPDHPVPTITLTPATSSKAASVKPKDNTARTLGIVGIVVGAIALLMGASMAMRKR